MPDIFYLISKWWKQILLVILLSMAVVAAVVFLKAPRYLSVSTALPVNSALTDKARIFNRNIQYLYPSIGGSDQLDIVLGTAQLDTVYIPIAAKFDLIKHYKLKQNGKNNLEKAADQLRKSSKVIRSEYGELKVKVWDKDKSIAAQLSNAIMGQLNAIHRELQNQNNRATLNALVQERQKLTDTIDNNQLAEYDKLISEYRLIVETKPDALLIVEKARPPLRPDQPRSLMILAATAFLAFLFGLALALVLERRKKIAA